MKTPTRILLSLLLAPLALFPMSEDLDHPYPRETPYTQLYGDPSRGPEPNPGQIEEPLTEWDESLAQSTCNQGNPYDDYGHFRLKDDAWRQPYIIEEGSDDWDMTQTELTAAAQRFDETLDWEDGSLVKYQILTPPESATMPANGWPLVVYCPGSGAIGRDRIISWKVDGPVIWASSYYREHYPAYVLVLHPQTRTTEYPDLERILTTPAFDAYLEVIDAVILNNPVDQNRIYTLGFSMGGATVWQLLVARPDFFAAAAPAAGRPLEPGNSTQIEAAKGSALWMSMGNQDPWMGSAKYLRTYQDLVAAGATQVRFWEVQDMDHVPSPMMMYHLPEWMFAQTLDTTVEPQVPVFLDHPDGVSVDEGGEILLQSNVNGVPFPTVHWEKNGAKIPGANEFTLRIEEAELTDAGDYTAVATNSEGAVVSETAVVSVIPDTQPPVITEILPLSPESLAILFDEPVLGGTGAQGAENPDNYAISSDVEVLSATRQEDRRTVILEVSSLTEGATYTATVSHLQDLASSPNAISQTATSFTFRSAIEIRIDFEQAETDPEGHWNTIPNTGTTTELLDYFTGAPTPVEIRLEGGITDSTSTGAWGTRTRQPFWALPEVLSDRFYITEGGTGSLSLHGLVPGQAYDIEWLASYGGAGTSGDDPGIYTLTDATGKVEAFNGLTGDSLGTEASWTPRGPGEGGVEGWLTWDNAVADDQGRLQFSLSAPSGSNPRIALNALRIVSVPAQLPTPPQARIFPAASRSVDILFPTERGFTYILESSEDLEGDSGWSDIPGKKLSGSGFEETLNSPLPDTTPVFYRIRVD